MTTFAYIDASNLFYGGEKSLGFKIDYQKLLKYLKEKYGAEKAFYFGGAEIYDFPYDSLLHQSVPIEELENYLVRLLENKGQKFDEAKLFLFNKHLQRVRFYRKLQSFGYTLFLKPVKMYEQEDGTTERKANCDVEMAFNLMRDKDQFERLVILSGDGDFLPVLKHLKSIGKDVFVLARGPRTAKEIRRFAGGNFRDFEYLKYLLKFEEK